MPHRLIKKKIIAQLIYKKLGVNQYKQSTNKLLPRHETPQPHRRPAKLSKNTTSTNPFTATTPSDSPREHLDTRHQAPPNPQREPKQKGQAERPKIIHQAAIDTLLLASFFPLPVFFCLPLIGVPVRRQAIDLPKPGLATSTLASKSHSSFAKRAFGFGVGANTSGSMVMPLTGITCPRVVDEGRAATSKTPCSKTPIGRLSDP